MHTVLCPQVRAQAPQMFNIAEWDNVWGLEAKTACFNKWDPEKPRDYENFNPVRSRPSRPCQLRHVHGSLQAPLGLYRVSSCLDARPHCACVWQFESNDESAKCDSNGCFPGQSRGYRPPNRPDASWAIMQAEKVAMEELSKDPKWGLSGKPGTFSLKWQEKLGMPPIYD